VTLGAHDLSKMEANKQTYSVDGLFFHPESGQADKFDYDLAIMQISPRLEGRKDFNMKFLYKPICLPKSKMLIRKGSTVVAAGWGIKTERGIMQ
jgi:trypsin